MSVYNNLKECEERLMYLYVKASSKSKKTKIGYDLLSFKSLCHKFAYIPDKYNWETNDELPKLANPHIHLIKESQTNIGMFDDISSSVIRTYKESDFEYYKYYKKGVKVLPYNELKDIFLSFLNSYDENLTNIFLKKLNDNEITFSNNLGLANGEILYIMSINKTPIFINNNLSTTLYTASVLAHELGHLYESEIVKNTRTKSHFLISTSSVYHEVASEFFKYLFLNYLKDNNIYISDVDILFNRYYIVLLYYIIGINFICNNHVILNRNLDIKPSDELDIFLSNVREDFNYYSIFSDNIINYKDTFIYGIGSLFSIYLLDTYKKDPAAFKKEFKNAMINYPVIGIEAFKNLGVTEDILEEGTILKKVLKT